MGGLSPGACARIAVGVEGTDEEVAWMIAQLQREWQALGIAQAQVFEGSAAEGLWSRIVEFPGDPDAALVIKAGMVPSAVAEFVRSALELAPGSSIEAHAGSGVVYVRLAEFSAADAARLLVRGLQPAAVKAGGQAIVLSCAAATELTHQAVWGPPRADARLMRAVKLQLDPRGLLNPGRTMYEPPTAGA